MPFCLIWLCFKPLLKSIPQTDHYSFSEKPDRKALAEEALSVLAAAKQFTAVLIYGPMSNGPEGRFLFHYAENRFCSSSLFPDLLWQIRKTYHTYKGDFMKNDPGLQEEKKIPEPPKPSWFQVAGDVDDFIFYYETEKTCSQR